MPASMASSLTSPIRPGCSLQPQVTSALAARSEPTIAIRNAIASSRLHQTTRATLVHRHLISPESSYTTISLGSTSPAALFRYLDVTSTALFARSRAFRLPDRSDRRARSDDGNG